MLIAAAPARIFQLEVMQPPNFIQEAFICGAAR